MDFPEDSKLIHFEDITVRVHGVVTSIKNFRLVLLEGVVLADLYCDADFLTLGTVKSSSMVNCSLALCFLVPNPDSSKINMILYNEE